jgi:hypothetical protein
MQCNVLGEEDKVDVLYGAAEPAVAQRVRQHVSACAACRDEMAELESTRQRLGMWTLEGPSRPPAALGLASSWALPFAAAILLALGAAYVLHGSELRYEGGRLSFRIGRADDQPLRQLLAEQEARHQTEIAALQASLAQAADKAPVVSRADVLDFIRESETRQNHRFLAGLEELEAKSDSQRRLDMARVSAGLSYLDGKNGQHVARTSELMNTMLQASYRR